MKTVNFLLCLIATSVIGSPVNDTRIVNGIGTSVNDDGRIVGGVAVHNSEAPYIVRLVHASLSCAGTLVKPNRVVTAAHCVYGRTPSEFTIVAGVTTINEVGFRSAVSTISVHPDFNFATKHSDAAVLVSSLSFDYTPILRLTDRPLNVGDQLHVYGWGLVGEGLQGSDILRTVPLPVRDFDVCKNEYRHFVEKNMFCASGFEAKGSCRGDSGGPAVFKDPMSNDERLCGIVSFSYKCGEVGRTEVYVDVYSVKGFIEDAMMFPLKYPNKFP